jgi:hypothetical protein
MTAATRPAVVRAAGPDLAQLVITEKWLLGHGAPDPKRPLRPQFLDPEGPYCTVQDKASGSWNYWLRRWHIAIIAGESTYLLMPV